MRMRQGEKHTAAALVRWEKFAQCIHGGMTQLDAYIAVYGRSNQTDKTIIEKASRLASKSYIENRLEELWRDECERNKVTDNWIITQLREIATHAPKSADRVKALELLGKNLKMFTDKTEITGKDGESITINVVGV
jgi:hypothetical protein